MTSHLTSSLPVVGLGFIAFLGCASKSGSQPEPALAKSTVERVVAPQVTPADATTLAADNAAFALDAYRLLRAEHANLVFSPASLSIALAMTYAGAMGTTAAEMATTLHFTLPPERLHPAFNALDLALSSRGQGRRGSDGGPMQVNIVNAVWAEEKHTFRSDYLDTLGANYGAGVNLMDFVNNGEGARKAINDWVASQTSQRITNLLPPGSLDSVIRLVLTNAVCLNAAWKQPFASELTHDGDFMLPDSTSTRVKFMVADLAAAPSLQGVGFAAVALPYDDERLSLLVVVPDSGTFDAFESSLNTTQLDGIVTGLTSRHVSLLLPRFRTETDHNFLGTLKSLGMNSAFTPGAADFSGMDITESLYISQVLHKALIEVAEQGTEAVAGTAVLLAPGSAAPAAADLTITVDRPFLYFLRDEPTGAILFMGRVLDPSKT